MNSLSSPRLRTVLLLSTLCTAPVVLADPSVVLDHNAKAGPKHEAAMHCYQAARDSVGRSQHLRLTNRVVTERSAEGHQAIVLSGTIWEDGARVPIEARCETNDTGELVASVVRTFTGLKVAKASN